jgi:hypothetical protein
MSDNQAQDISAFFDKHSKQKQKNQKLQQQEKKKQEEQQRRAEEERQAAKASAAGGDYVSSDEEDTRGAQIEIGQSKVKDIKQKKKEQELAKDARSEQEFNWNQLGGGIQASQSAPTT